MERQDPTGGGSHRFHGRRRLAKNASCQGNPEFACGRPSCPYELQRVATGVLSDGIVLDAAHVPGRTNRRAARAFEHPRSSDDAHAGASCGGGQLGGTRPERQRRDPLRPLVDTDDFDDESRMALPRVQNSRAAQFFARPRHHRIDDFQMSDMAGCHLYAQTLAGARATVGSPIAAGQTLT